MFERLVRISVNLEFGFVFNVLFVNVWVGVDVSQHDVLPSDSSELDSSQGGALGEDVASHRERGDQLSKLFLLYAVTVGGAVEAALVKFRSAQSKQYLVVAKVVSRMEREVLIFIFLI